MAFVEENWHISGNSHRYLWPHTNRHLFFSFSVVLFPFFRFSVFALQRFSLPHVTLSHCARRKCNATLSKKSLLIRKLSPKKSLRVQQQASGPVASTLHGQLSCILTVLNLWQNAANVFLYFSNERLLLHIRRALILTSVQNSSRIGCSTVITTSGKRNTTNSQDDHSYQATRSHFSPYVTLSFFFLIFFFFLCLDLQTIILLYSLKIYRRCRNKGCLYPSSDPGEQNFWEICRHVSSICDPSEHKEVSCYVGLQLMRVWQLCIAHATRTSEWSKLIGGARAAGC